jgi:hypothetical protein
MDFEQQKIIISVNLYSLIPTKKKPFSRTINQHHLKTLTKLSNNDNKNYFKIIIL